MARKGKPRQYFADAGVRNNGAGPLQSSVIVGADEDGALFERYAEGYTNNESELLAIIYTASAAPEKSQIFSDSQLAVNLVYGRWQTKYPRLRLLSHVAKNIIEIKNQSLAWRPREANLAGVHIEERYGL